jgi:hypothetical protein
MSDNEIVDPCRVSYHVVGLHDDGQIFMLSLDPQKVWECHDWETRITLQWICTTKAPRPAKLIGFVRVQREGDELKCYHTAVEENAESDLALTNAVAYVMAAGTGFIEENTRELVEELAYKCSIAEALNLFQVGGE